jgi:hypothetical protein
MRQTPPDRSGRRNGLPAIQNKHRGGCAVPNAGARDADFVQRDEAAQVFPTFVPLSSGLTT